MAHSPMYHRLMMFVEAAKANEALAAYDNEHSAAMEAIDGSSESIQHFRQYQGFEGETGTAIDGWLEKADNREAGWRASYLSASQIEVEMRRVMMHAREEAERLSPVLVDKGLDSLRDVAEVTIPVMKHYGISGKVVSAVVSTGAAVYDAIAAQANAQREANAADILQRLNASMQGLADQANQVVASQKQLEAQNEEWDPSALPHPSSPSTAQQLANGHKWVSAHEGVCIRGIGILILGVLPCGGRTRACTRVVSMTPTPRARRCGTPTSFNPGVSPTAWTPKESRARAPTPSPTRRT